MSCLLTVMSTLARIIDRSLSRLLRGLGVLGVHFVKISLVMFGLQKKRKCLAYKMVGFEA